jgi:NAD(P)-dependent dehydrogenase (short-subunit alcohol dehydrogenase family)
MTTTTPTAGDIFSLDGTVAMVTGATSGLGLATAEVLASAGARTILSGLGSEHPDRVAADRAAAGLPIEGFASDVTSMCEARCAWQISRSRRWPNAAADHSSSCRAFPVSAATRTSACTASRRRGSAQLARNLAVQWGEHSVRVNTISPGVIATDFAKPITEGPGREVRLAKTQMKRFGDPSHVAGTVLYLASAAGGFTTGQNLVIDGGTLVSD